MEAMDQIFRNYLINKDAERQKSSILKPPKTPIGYVKKKSERNYDTIVKLVDNEAESYNAKSEPTPKALTPTAKRQVGLSQRPLKKK